MERIKRFAGDTWRKYESNATYQDIAETLGYAGLAAGGQALFTDMTPEEIAVSTGVSIGAALAARKVFSELGFVAGAALDKKFPRAAKSMAPLSPYSPEGRKFYNELMKKTGSDVSDVDLQVMNNFMQAKQNQNFIKPDGTPRGFLEGTLASFGRNRGDNLAQAAVAFGTPLILGQDDEAQ